MAVPEEIRRVQRPPNTVVVDTGKDSPNRYPVREVVKVVGKAGKVVSTQGKVIGHIRDLVFVPKPGASGRRHPLPYGDAAMVHAEAREIFTDLTKCFSLGDACKIAAIAMLRVLYPRTTQYNLADWYRSSYLSVLMPGIPLSRTTISKFVQDLGMHESAIGEFCKLRLDRIADGHLVLVRATHKGDPGKIESLADYTLTKARWGMPEISVLYAYDADAEEPVCARAHEGRSVDLYDCRHFVQRHDLGRGAIVVDEELAREAARDIACGNAGLHFISRLDRDDRLVLEHAMFAFEDRLPEHSEVLYRKKAASPSLFLYSFCDLDEKHAEEEASLESIRKGELDPDEHRRKEPSFGTTIFASDLDLPPLKVYRSQLNLWRMEMMLRQFRHDIVPNTPGVCTQAAIAGCEFINLVSTAIMARLFRKFDSLCWLREWTYEEIMRDLAYIRRYDDAPRFQLPDRDDMYWEYVGDGLTDMLVEAGLCTNVLAQTPRRPGRPRKQPAEPDRPRRPRGRPRKEPSEKAPQADRPKRKPGRPKSGKTLAREALEAEMLARSEVPPKRAPGRPKGSRNRKTLEREANGKEAGQQVQAAAQPE